MQLKWFCHCYKNGGWIIIFIYIIIQEHITYIIIIACILKLIIIQLLLEKLYLLKVPTIIITLSCSIIPQPIFIQGKCHDHIIHVQRLHLYTPLAVYKYTMRVTEHSDVCVHLQILQAGVILHPYFYCVTSVIILLLIRFYEQLFIIVVIRNC